MIDYTLLTGTWLDYSGNPTDNVVKYWNEQMAVGQNIFGCFGSYFTKVTLTNQNSIFLFSFPAIPTWYKRIINKFNRKFKNIQYNIITERDIFLQLGYTGINYRFKPFDNQNYPAKQVLFSLSFKEYYNFTSIYFLRYFLHHFIRQMSYAEKYIPIDCTEHDKKYCSIQWILDINKDHAGNRSLVEGNLSKEFFMLLDNPDIVNASFDRICDIRQTEIMSRIILTSGKDIPSVFKVGDLVRESVYNRQYALREGVVTEILPFDKVKVDVIKHDLVINHKNVPYSSSRLEKIEKETK